MVQGFASPFGGFNIDLQIVLEGSLPDIIVETLRTERRLPGILGRLFRGNDASCASKHLFILFSAQAFYVFILHDSSPLALRFAKLTKHSADQI